MAKCGVVLSFLFLLFCFNYLSVEAIEPWARTIYVSPIGNDSIASGNTLSPCKTLDHALQIAQTAGSSTRVFLRPGNYNLTRSFTFTKIQNFSLFGSGGSRDVVISCPSKNTSLAFLQVKGLFLQGFTLSGCGEWHNSSVGLHDWIVANPMFITAIYINYCVDLTVSQVNISDTPGVGLNAYTIAGKVKITDSYFDQNVPIGSNETNINVDGTSLFMADSAGKYAKAGGGVFLLMGTAKNNPLILKPEELSQYLKSNNLINIANCSFTRNRAPTPNLGNISEIPSLPFSRGGGLAIFISGNSSNNIISIDSSRFTQNEAVWGGGLQIELKKKTQNTTITISNTKFRYNNARAEGGGLRLASYINDDITLLPNYLNLISCEISGNTATWGGGLTTYGSTFLAMPNRLVKYQQSVVTFKSCNITDNKGTIGAAIGAFLVNRNLDEVGPGVPYSLIFDHCIISDNNVILREPSYVVGQGAVYSDEVPLIFKNNVTIFSNSGTAVVLDSATMTVHDTVYFTQNSGYRGGGLALYGNAKVTLMKNSRLIFLENYCNEKGGAMYVSAPGPPLVSFNSNGVKIHKCFFTYEEDSKDYGDWQTEIVFQGNAVQDESFATDSSGRSVFASTLRDCLCVGETRENNTALAWNFIKYRNKNGTLVGIKGEVVTDPIDIIYNRSEWKVAPSQVFKASLRLIDEKENLVYGIVQINVKGITSTSTRLGGTSLFLVYSEVANLFVIGKPGDYFEVVLKTTSKHLVHKTIKNLQLQDCSAGYHYKGNRCVCLSDKERGIYNCSNDGHTVFIRDGYWAGIVDKKFRTHKCPNSYCAVGSLSGQSIAYKYEQLKMCIATRSSDSILCGSCKKNYTVLVGSEECSLKCNDYYLLTIIPYGIIFFLAIMLIMLINLDVFTTYLNAWLYSYQVMNLLFIEGFTLDSFMQFMIGLANIQIKAGGSCLMTNITDADKLMLMYILPTYILVAVFILAKVVRKWPNWCYSRRVKAPFRALCTLFVLCYTNITSISLKILYPAFIGDKTVMFMDGEVDFFKGKHIGYAIVAIIYLLLVVIPCPLILMFTPFFTKLLRPIVNVNTLKPYYDAFQGCFKDQYRWCSAFYFICRLYLLLVSTFMPTGPWKRVLLEDSCMLILAVFVYLKPYKEQYNWLNLLDTVLLSNLGIMAIFSTALQYPQNYPTSYHDQFVVFIKVLSYVPLCYLICLLVYLAFQYREYLREYMTIRMRLRAESTVLDNYSESDPEGIVSQDNDPEPPQPL